MSENTLYQRTLDAALNVRTYKNADIDDWIAEIDPILKAAGECVIGRDKVESILVSDKDVSIETSYSVRCCDQSNEMSIPLHILNSDDPAKAANKFRIESELKNVMHQKSCAQKTIEACLEKEKILQSELDSMGS